MKLNKKEFKASVENYLMTLYRKAASYIRTR